MGRTCTICKHPKRKEIDEAMLTDTVRHVAKRFNVNSTAIQRHKVHIRTAVARAQNKNGLTIWSKMEKLLEEAEKQYKANKGMLKATWFREMRSTIQMGVDLGIEAKKAQETEHKDVTPAVEKMIEEGTL